MTGCVQTAVPEKKILNLWIKIKSRATGFFFMNASHIRIGMSRHLRYVFLLLLSVAVSTTQAAQPPALPQGLGGGSEAVPPLPPGLGNAPQQRTGPALPSGLGGRSTPSLPTGLGGAAPASIPRDDSEPHPSLYERLKAYTDPVNLTGFVDTRVGTRLVSDPYADHLSVAEVRLQLEMSRPAGPVMFNLTTDLVYDFDYHEHDIRLEEGDGWLDLREASAAFSPLSFVDIKAGRQILTWGTGDLIFINDLFPKDWKSFFIGRDDEYLKAPSDAIKLSVYPGSPWPNLDIVYTPRFDADRYIDGTRISYWNPRLGRRSGEEVDGRLPVGKPDDWLEDDELAMRLFRNVRGYELALYGYSGYWKSPAGIDVATGSFTFPKLNVYGLSARGPIGPGIGYIEAGWYDSRQDRDGEDPVVPNSELRFLAGYEKEVATDLTATVQYYVEHMLDHDAYLANAVPGMPEADETRHTLTFRLRQMLFKQDLELSIFVRYSPTDNDAYFKPKASYKLNDFWQIEIGGNFFAGRDAYTFLGQFERNNNVYAAARCSF
jgi:PAS domain-containing protein